MRRKVRPPIDVPELFRQWQAGIPAREIALNLGVTAAAVQAARMQYGLPKRPRQKIWWSDDPTPEQIAERAAAIKAKNLEAMRALG